MNTYEAMFLVDAKLDKSTSEVIFNQIKETITKEGGGIISSRLWIEKQRMSFPIKKKQQATYYLVDFSLQPDLIEKIKKTYRLNEDILRVLITRLESQADSAK